MLKSVNIPSCIISSVCVTAQIFSRLTVLDDVLHLLPDSEGQVAQVSWHMNQSSRRRLWIRLWDLDSGRTFRIRTAVTLPSEAERPETPADHSPFHRDWKLLQNKHTIYHQELNQSSINQSINGWSEIRPLESRRHWLSSSPPCLWLCVKELRCVCSSPPASPYHLLLLLLFLSQCSDCSFFFISEKLMKLLKLLFNLTLCVLSLRLKSNHIHFNHLINTHQHITSFRSKRNSDTRHITDPEADCCSSFTTIINWNLLY